MEAKIQTFLSRFRIRFNRALVVLAMGMMMFIFSPSAWSDKSREVVLVTSVSSKIGELSLLEIRRLYLGYSIDNEHVNKPLINRSNERLYEDFLKNILHVTREGYKRKIVRRVFRHGAEYIVELKSIKAISQHLQKHPNDVVFITRNHIDEIENVKVVVRLW
jgi:hypothetical protein